MEDLQAHLLRVDCGNGLVVLLVLDRNAQLNVPIGVLSKVGMGSSRLDDSLLPSVGVGSNKDFYSRTEWVDCSIFIRISSDVVEIDGIKPISQGSKILS